MSDQTEFLSARIDEDEQAAWAVAAGWEGATYHIHTPEYEQYYPVEGPANECESMHERWFGDAWVDLANLFTAARVLAECESKRQIVEDFEVYAADALIEQTEFAAGRRHAATLAVARIASVYADHPDYDETWRA